MLKNALLFVSFFAVINCLGQEGKDTTYKRLLKFPVFSFDYINYSNSDFEVNAKSGTLNVNEYTTQLQFAIPIKKRKTYLFNSIKYSYTNYKISTSNALYSSKDIHSIRYNLGVLQILPGRWKLAMNMIPALSTDFKEALGTDDFSLYASIIAMKRSSPNLEFGFGLAYSSYVVMYESALVLPLFSLTCQKNRFITRIIFPSFISQSYKINEKTQVGVRAGINGGLYNIKFDNNLTNLDLNSFSNTKLIVGPDFQRKLVGDIYLNGSMGIIAFNKFDFQDNDKKTELSFNTNSQFYLKLGIVLLK